MKSNSLELLMPAGDFEKMQYAIAFGADAVYLGMPRYSLRARENGFKKMTTVVEAVNYAHRLEKKVYITANILPHNHKAEPFIRYVNELLKFCQPDAWIISDPGLIMLMKEHHPEQIIHLSVQANTVNYASAQFWHKQGVKRIILSRELSIKEMSVIHGACPGLELEAFVHGAICIAYSGRCLISNYMSYRDSNQGTCANSCRWSYKLLEKGNVQPSDWKDKADSTTILQTQHLDSYVSLKGDFYLEEAERPGEFMPIDEDENGTYLMNSRDLCGISYIKELKEAGITSFKVEGRSKSVYYTALIARAYRRTIDDVITGKSFNPDVWNDIYATSNRGLIAGFLKGNPGHTAQSFKDGKSNAMTYRFTGILRGYDAQRRWMKVEARNPIKKGMSLEIILPDKTEVLTVDTLYNEKMQKTEIIHGGTGICWIPFYRNPGEFVLFREKIKNGSILPTCSKPD